MNDTILDIPAETRVLLDSIPHAVMLLDDRHRILFANKKARQNFPEDTDGKSGAGRCCYRVVHQREKPLPDCPLSSALRGG